MIVQRWRFTNVLTSEQWTVPQNPSEMDSVFPERQVEALRTTAVDGNVLLWERATPPREWSFRGSIRNSNHYDGLRKWVYETQRIVIRDHFGRDIYCILKRFDPTPTRALNVYWRHDYEIVGLVFHVTAPTIGLDS